MNLATAIVLIALIMAVFAIIKGMLKNKKSGKRNCSCGCETCPNSNMCQINEDVAKLNEFATSSWGFMKIVQNGRNEGAQPPCPKAYGGTSSGEFRS